MVHFNCLFGRCFFSHANLFSWHQPIFLIDISIGLALNGFFSDFRLSLVAGEHLAEEPPNSTLTGVQYGKQK